MLELSVKFASQICHENIKKPLDGAYLADFSIDIIITYKKQTKEVKLICWKWKFQQIFGI